MDDLLAEVQASVSAGLRVLVTTLTKRMAEDLTEYYQEIGIKVRYLHSDIDTIERMAIPRPSAWTIRCLVVSILREGLDLPEVG